MTINVDSINIVIVASIPPPYHGSSIMAKAILFALKDMGFSVKLIRKKYSTNITDLGKFQIKKIIHLMNLFWRVLTSKANLYVFFISSSYLALMSDILLLILIRMLRRKYILRFGGIGFKKYKDKPIVSRLLVYVFSGTEIAVIKSYSLINDLAPFNIKKENCKVIANTVFPVPKLIKYSKRVNKVENFLFLSNLIPSKGVFEAIKATKVLVREHGLKNVKLKIAGANSTAPSESNNEEFTSKLYRYIKKFKLEDNITFVGPCYGTKKWRLLSNADVFIFPTYYEYETFGIVNIEAMAAGLPVISTDYVAIPEIVKHERTGFIVPTKDYQSLADKMKIFIDNPSLVKQMGDRGRSRYEKYYSFNTFKKNWSENILNVLQQII